MTERIPCYHHCQMSWDSGRCCYTSDLNETQAYVCDACEDRHGVVEDE